MFSLLLSKIAFFNVTRCISFRAICRICLSLAILGSSFSSIAADLSPNETLIFEQSPPIHSPIQFKHDSPLLPDNNDFELLHWQFMSNRNGERWAMVTLKNTASGQRLFAHKDIVATFANGQQSFPVTEIRESFQANEVKTMSIYFGERRFPLAFVQVQ